MMRMVFFLLLSLAAIQAQALQSGIDDGGYHYVDSAEASFDFDFENIAFDFYSTRLWLRDDQSRTINIGFDFDFYDVHYSSLKVSANGFLSFTSSNSGCCQGKQIPSSDSASNMGAGIAAWWEDLNPSRGGSVHYQTTGLAPNRQLIVQFTDVPAYSNNGRNTFQYKLFEADYSIEVHYKELYGDSGNYSIGIQKNAQVGLQRYFGPGGSRQNNVPAFDLPYAIRYQPAKIGYRYHEQIQSGILSPGQTTDMTIELINSDSSPVEVMIDYFPLNSALSLNGPSALTLLPNQTTHFDIDINTPVAARRPQDVALRISSPDQHFEAFDIPLRFNIVALQQLSRAGSTKPSFQPSLSANGERLVVLSRDDLANTNKFSNRTDLFWYDQSTQLYRQLSHNPVGRNCKNAEISGDGRWAVAICDSSLDSERPNQDRSDEIYLFDLEGQSLRQVAAHLDASTGSEDLAINHDGSVIAFISDANLSGDNPDHSYEAFAYRVRSDEFMQLTQFDYGHHVAAIDLDFNGQRFVTSSRANPRDQNANFKWQVFAGELGRGITRQLTDSPDYDSGLPKISGDGRHVSFSSRADYLLSHSQTHSATSNIFIARFNGSIVERITHSAQFDSGYAELSSDGSRVMFISQGSFDGTNAAANGEVFVYDRKRQSMYQLSEINDVHDAQFPSFCADGSAVAYSGAGDWQRSANPQQRSQLFLLSGLLTNDVRGYPTSEQAAPLPVITPTEDEEYRKKTSTQLTQSPSETDAAGGALFYWLLTMGLCARLRRHSKARR